MFDSHLRFVAGLIEDLSIPPAHGDSPAQAGNSTNEIDSFLQ
ncbi:hypothetical protein RMSM_06775 [Rhodopirellula maiorica SM1]|uniref:Uncharacterized protein n=1 Tax=Rhodopirellula maiorica SM1 TaxID=1265738 RepID=M5RB84_9BACT|nr:hypothetical protein [Rhodopirellula maiorica]EMI16296.1 hypothetical protein RMSM_06775 [Rhodopirellula maiorica SM1]